jgi:hypothetical protein
MRVDLKLSHTPKLFDMMMYIISIGWGLLVIWFLLIIITAWLHPYETGVKWGLFIKGYEQIIKPPQKDGRSSVLSL